jgi:hypothetical protein
MPYLSDSESADSHSLSYIADGWSICVLASGPAGHTVWRIHGKRDGVQFHATGATLAEAWKRAAFQALDRLLQQQHLLDTSLI